MDVFNFIITLGISYLIGSIPFGFIITKLTTGKDVRQYESGRTGTTNTMRVAGIKAALLTGIFDLLKGTFAVWLAYYIMPENLWLQVLAPVAAILGHNYSIFMLNQDPNGRFQLGGGAGGATSVGGALGLWWPSIFFILPIGIILWMGVGYASLATLSVGIIAVLIFTYRAAFENAAWIYIAYGVLVEIIVIWALRPNIKRLANGTERIVGIRAK